MPRRQSRNRPKRWNNLTKGLLAAVPLLGLLWAIVTYALDHSGKRDPDVVKWQELISTSYIRLETDAILDFVGGKSSATSTKPPRYRKSGLMKSLFDAFTKEALARNGRTIGGATFLLITNRAATDVQRVEIENGEGESAFGHLGPGETLILCVRLEKTNHTTVVQPVRKATFVTPAITFPRTPDPIPRPDSMLPVPGTSGTYAFYPPSQQKK